MPATLAAINEEVQEVRDIVHVPVHVLQQQTAVQEIDRHIENAAALRVAFLNVHLANAASARPNVREALNHFLILNDGFGVDLASIALYGKSFPQNLNGTDFMPFFLGRTKHNLRLFLLGGTPDVVEQAARLMAVRWPRHQVVGFHHGFFSADEGAEVAARVRRAGADVVLVAMGNPRQELWISEHIPGACNCAFGVGAFLDFLTGHVSRAPSWIRRLRCEWLYRIACEPRRLWKRYVVGIPIFFTHVAFAMLRGHAFR